MFWLIYALGFAFDFEMHTMSYDDVGYIPPRTEESARGAGLIRSHAEGFLIWNPKTEEIVVFQEQSITTRMNSPYTSDILWDSFGNILVLQDSLRLISVWNREGVRISSHPLPRLLPMGGQLIEKEQQVYSKDIFGNLHRIGNLGGAKGLEILPRQPLQEAEPVLWDKENKRFVWGKHTWHFPEAIRASAQLVGTQWVVIDEVVADRPISVRRRVIHIRSGKEHFMAVEDRKYVPDSDFTLRYDGAFVYLQPDEHQLNIMVVKP